MTGRRLRQPDPQGGAADVGLAQQGVERGQEIEVERIQIHEANRYHIHYRFGEFRGGGDDLDVLTKGDAAMSASANKKLMQDIFAAAASRDPAARGRPLFTESLADDAKWIVTGQYSWSRTFSGKEAILNDLHAYVRTRLVDRTRTGGPASPPGRRGPPTPSPPTAMSSSSKPRATTSRPKACATTTTIASCFV